MEDVDTDPFGEHESRPEEPTDESIPLTPVGGGSTWDPKGSQALWAHGNQCVNKKHHSKAIRQEDKVKEIEF